MIRATKVWKAFGAESVLRGVSFALDSGESVGLVGPSGGGKSVLLKLLGGVLAPDRGEVQIDRRGDEPIAVGLLFQESALFDSMTVLENVAFPLLVVKDRAFHSEVHAEVERVSRSEALDRAHRILAEVGLRDAWRKVPGQLSGGMRRRVGIARALVEDPKLLLLDDPTGGLDPVAASVIMNLISEIHERYHPTVIMASHDIRRLLPRVDRVLCLFEGTIVSDLPPENLEHSAPEHIVRFLKTRFEFAELAP